jgi:hypothetical protein
MDRPEDILLARLRGWKPRFLQALQSGDQQWRARGIIDSEKQLYPLPNDTKLISKVIEIMLTLALQEFASHFRYRLEFAQHQNHYPDVTIHDENGNLFALDIKTAYREGEDTISGMTLGTFTGYFRDRAGTKNITYPYNSYTAHLVLGVIYSRVGASLPPQVYALEQIDSLPIPLKDFEVFVQPKYRIASDRPGSGNTKNIGAVREVDALVNGKGPFANLGKKFSMTTGKDTSLPTWRDKRELRNHHTQVCKSICKSKGQEARYEVE